MVSSIAILFTSLLAGFVAAQGNNITIDPNSVSLTERNSWCNGQVNTCGMLCGGQVDANNCTGSDLTYSCLCASNHSAPALSLYLETLPFRICQSAFGKCITDHPDDRAGQDQCKQTYVCGTLNASMAQIATTSSASSAMPTSTMASATGSSGMSTPSATTNLAVKFGQDYGVGVLVAAVFAVVGMAL
ncbi:hypothetical protein MMC24_001077 [Lignoscripta atroalba]|nr:hypothetical protein [Lignoscripta atroalba]